MTKGKIVNKQTGLEILGEKSSNVLENDRIFWFAIEGAPTTKPWFKSVYEFIEDKPTPYEQYKALKPGQKFRLREGDSFARIKLDDTTFARHGVSWTFQRAQDWLDDDSVNVEAVDD
jgi:hypothetical protein